MSKTPTVYVVDDDAAMRKSTAMVLEAHGHALEMFESAVEFLDRVNPGDPGCVVLDLHMPEMSGMDLVARMREEKYSLPVLVVSGTGSIPIAVEGMKLGLYDFLVKPVDPEVLIQKVAGALQLDSQRRTASAEVEPIRMKLLSLTPREQELLAFIVCGMANKNISDKMGISIKTVENHRASLMAKTGALNVADLVRMKMLATET